MRELMMALSDFERNLEAIHGVSLNEAMTLCAISNECIAVSVVIERTGLRPSHTSKVIGALESKNYIKRKMGTNDKRQIYLSLTIEGKECLNRLKSYEFDIPEQLRPIFVQHLNNIVE